MKILHVVPTYLPAVRYGGPIASVHGLCRALVRRGHDVHVFTTNIDGDRDSDVPLDAPVDVDGVQVHYFRSPALRRLFWSPSLARALRRDVAAFDLVHTHSLFLWPTQAAAAAARRRGVPYLVAPRGMLVRELVRARSPLAKRAWIRLFERRNLEKAAAIHVTSDLERSECQRFDPELRWSELVILPNGTDAGEPSAAAPSTPHVAAAIARGPYLLFLGRLSWKKGVDRLLRALALVPGARLVLAGNDDEGRRNSLERLAEELDIAGRTEFVGAVAGADKAALLAHCTALVAPSISENFGNVVLEAMATGKPVVTSPGVGLAETVRRWNAGIVCDSTPAVLGEQLERLLADPERRASWGANGRRAVAAELTWDAVAREAESTYARLVRSAALGLTTSPGVASAAPNPQATRARS